MSARAGFVPLQDFWADYMRDHYTRIPGKLEASAVAPTLDGFFGALTSHGVDDPDALPGVLTGLSCRNNTPERRSSTCETHVGVVRGLLEARLGVPLEISYDPVPCKECRIRVDVLGTAAGRPVVARARRAAHVLVLSRPPEVHDLRTGARTAVSGEVVSLLELLDEFRTARELADAHALDYRATVALLDALLASGWIDHEFAPRDAEGVP